MQIRHRLALTLVDSQNAVQEHFIFSFNIIKLLEASMLKCELMRLPINKCSYLRRPVSISDSGDLNAMEVLVF